ncbi:MAG: hypothetical protein V3W41_16005 [Planctomycetota bacterium]
MIRIALVATLLVFILVPSASSQISVNIGPTTAPIGCDIIASVTNDTPSTFLIGQIGPVRVLNALGLEIFNFQAFIFAPIPVSPGQAIVHFRWDQTDNNGNQVAPGIYSYLIDVNGVTTAQTITIGGVDAALTTVGVLRPGSVRNLYLCSPQDPGLIYAYAAALTSNTGIPTCGGVIPLDIDFLFNFSTTPGNGVFLNTVGLLAGPNDLYPGSTTAPVIAVPNNPALSGFSFEVAFFVVDFSAFCPIARISNATTLTIL